MRPSRQSESHSDPFDPRLEEVSGPPSSNDTAEGFIELLMVNRPKIFAYIFATVLDRDVAEDIMQETSASMWRNYAHFRPGSSFVAWGITIAHYRVLQYRRKRKTLREVPFSETTLNCLVVEATPLYDEMDDRLRALRGCLNRLKDTDRRLIEQHYLHNEPVKAMAQAAGYSVQNVYQNLARIQLMLMRCIRRKTTAESRRDETR